ncbi:MAG TPA: hypothetical protein VF015_00595 [Acidimicrobiales bacterium]
MSRLVAAALITFLIGAVAVAALDGDPWSDAPDPVPVIQLDVPDRDGAPTTTAGEGPATTSAATTGAPEVVPPPTVSAPAPDDDDDDGDDDGGDDDGGDDG